MTRILVAEDDRHLQRVISLWLERNGYQVFCAEDGETALRIFGELSPDILITDVNMPNMDGMTLAKAVLGESSRPVGVIILSCRVDMIGVGTELGDERVIHHAKPFSPSRLIEEVETLYRKIAARSAPKEPLTTGRRGA
jgi:DNA-binding response OmpR family regulator